MNKPLMILVLMVCLVSSVWAEKEGDADVQEYAGESFSSRATWANHLLWEGTATLREIAIGTKIKGVTDDTIRLFTVQSTSPRQALLFTDTSSSSTTPMENRWSLDTLYEGADGYYSAEIGDVDRDGDNDLIFGRSTSPYKLMWRYWTGTGWNTDDTVICEISGTGYMYDIAIGDADNDGNPDDIIFTTYRSVMRAWWNGSSWDTLTLWSGDASTCYGVAIGDFDAAHAGNEIVTVTYGASVVEITWNSTTTTWDTATIFTPAAAWHLYDVEVGDFDSDNPGAEIVVGNGGTIASTEGAVIEIYGSGTSWSYRPLYTPTGSEYVRELAIGDCLDENTGNEIVYVSSTSPYEARVVYGSGTTWSDQAIFTPGGTSYGVAVGDVDQYRAVNDEIAVTGSYDVYEAEQYWYANELAITTGGQLTYPFVISEAESVWARVKNGGTNTQNNFKVYLYLNGVAAESIDVATLASGDSVDVTFGFVPNAEGEINFTVFHSLAPDDYPVNDTLGTIDPVAGFPNRFHDWVFEAGTYKAEGFEYISSFPPTGWVVIDNDGGSYTWIWYTYSNSTYMHTGIFYASSRWESSTLQNDDWLITDVINPTAGLADSLGFYRRARSTTYAESLEVWAMSGQNVTDTIPGGILWAGTFNETSYAGIKVSLDSYDGQSIYIGFRNHGLNEYYLHLDDIYWTSNADAIGPDITLIEMPENTYDPGPYTVRAVITDPSGVLTDSLYYIIDDVATAIPSAGVVGDTFTYEIPTQSEGTVVDYYVAATDEVLNRATSAMHHFFVLSPMAPTDLTATGQVDSTVLLEWLPPGEELSYHGNIAYYWDGWAVDDMIATQFTPQHTPCKVEAFSITFYDSTSFMDTVEVHVWDDDGAGNPGTDLWVDTIFVSQVYPTPEVFDVSAEDITVSGDFHVGLRWLGPDSPYPLSDAGALTTRSKSNYGAGWISEGYDWVMSAVVSYVPPTPFSACSRRQLGKSTVQSIGKTFTRAVDGSVKTRRLPLQETGFVDFTGPGLLELILGIFNFEVGRSVVQGGPYATLGTTSQSSYIDNTVVSETQYYYVVIANYTAPDTFSYYSNEEVIDVDFTPPVYANTTYDSLVAGPWVVSTDITDWSNLAYDSLGYRTDGGTFVFVGNDSVSGNTYYYTIPDFPSYTLIEFYLFCQDDSWWQNTGRDPAVDYYAFTVTAIHEYKGQGLIPDHVFLNQNRPNPFARLTQIEYGVPRSMQVNISVYNAAGQCISTLVDETKAPGFYMVNWRGVDDLGRRLSEGVYFMRMTTDELTDTKKVIYIK